jgi:predicted outer membrane repeat protein
VAARRRPSARPRVEALEDRCVPATFTVLNNSDSGAGSLRQAILDANAAAGADTILFSPTINGQTITLATALPAISDALTVTGPGSNGVTVSGNNAVRLFQVNAGVTATLSGLTLTAGSVTVLNDGGAVLNNGNLTLTGVILQNNAAGSNGGAVASEGAATQLTVTDCTFTANTAASAGGAVFASGFTFQKLSVTSSTFSGNAARSSGGAISATTTSTLTGVTVTGNTVTANGSGAGIFNSGSMTVTNSTVASNVGLGSPFSGGGISNGGIGGSLSVTNSTIFGNLSQGRGGGLDNSSGSLIVSNSTVAGNTALANAGGGGILSTVVNTVNTSTLTLLNDTITGNVDDSQASFSAGGISIAGGGTSFTMNNTIVAQNSAAGAAPQPQDIRGILSNSFKSLNNFVGIDTGLFGITNGTDGNQVGTAAAPLDPKLGPLQDNGGPTLTRQPLPGSPVINAGNNAAAATLTTDQRGSRRVVGTTIDIGSVEFQPPSTAGMFDPATGTWYLRNSNRAGAPDFAPFAYGAPGWAPVVGDWNGDGVATVGVFDPASATWYLRNSNSAGAPDFTPFAYGGPGWIPVVGDWDGNGTTTIGVVDPSTMTWYLKNSNGAGAPDVTPFRYGAPGDIPVVGDWDANGTFTVGVFRPSNATWYLRNRNSAGAPDIAPFAYGASYMKPVVGDWDGDGKTTIGVFDRSGNGAWLLRNSNTPGAPNVAPFAYGAQTWTPVAGYYGSPPPLLLAAGGEGPGAAALSTGDLNGILAAALGRLQQAGVSADLVSRLASVTALIQPLAPGQLGEAQPDQNTISLSPDGAGHGWFVDPTPYRDEEFSGGIAFAGNPAAGREDLLTTVLHELGHLAGLPDDSGSALMAGTLPAGTRRTNALDTVFAGLGA